jgi:hypothetical protein
MNEHLDLEFLLSAGELQQVAFSLHEVMLHFHQRIKIDILTSCEIRGTSGTVKWQPEQINDMTMFAQLLGSEIRSYSIVGRELVIVFDSGSELILFEHEDELESFIPWHGDSWLAIRFGD